MWRQQVGGLVLLGAMVFLVLGLFSATFLGLALFCLAVGGLLTLFGLSFANHYELSIDLRTASKTVGAYDERFWADVMQILQAPSE